MTLRRRGYQSQSDSDILIGCGLAGLLVLAANLIVWSVIALVVSLIVKAVLL